MTSGTTLGMLGFHRSYSTVPLSGNHDPLMLGVEVSPEACSNNSIDQSCLPRTVNVELIETD